jgi:hypothetical protein
MGSGFTMLVFTPALLPMGSSEREILDALWPMVIKTVYRGVPRAARGLLHCAMTPIDSAKADGTMQFLVENYP